MRAEIEGSSPPPKLYTRRTFLKKAAEVAGTAAIGAVVFRENTEREVPMELPPFDKSQLGSNINTANIRHFGLDVPETIAWQLSLPGDHVRIAIPFNVVSLGPTSFDFSETDKVIAAARKAGKKIQLQMGIKTINWPEVHPPFWMDPQNYPTVHTKGSQIDADPKVRDVIKSYLRAVSEHYLPHPEIDSLHIENEPFSRRLDVSDYRYISPAFNTEEILLVKDMDKLHRPVMQNLPFDTPEYWPAILRNPHIDSVGFNIYNQHNGTPLPDSAFTIGYWGMVDMAAAMVRLARKNLEIPEAQIAQWLPNDPFSLQGVYSMLDHVYALSPTHVLFWDVEQIKAKGEGKHLAMIEAAGMAA